jgi:hypothetical protein
MQYRQPLIRQRRSITYSFGLVYIEALFPSLRRKTLSGRANQTLRGLGIAKEGIYGI